MMNSPSKAKNDDDPTTGTSTFNEKTTKKRKLVAETNNISLAKVIDVDATAQPNNNNAEAKQTGGEAGRCHYEDNICDDEEYSFLIEAWKKSLPIQNSMTTTENADAHIDTIRGSGVGKFQLSTSDYKYIWQLQGIIMENVSKGVTWGEASSNIDPRRRRYAFTSDSQRQQFLQSGIRIETPDTQDEKEHVNAMKYSTMTIEWSNEEEEMEPVNTTTRFTVDDPKSDKNKDHETELPKEYDNDKAVKVPIKILDALTSITHQIQQQVPSKYKQYVTIDNLIAVQPNHHNGAIYLPAHLDFPRADGFGVVIATIGVEGVTGSTVVLIDDGDTDEDKQQTWSFPLQDSECYFLSGNARNKCLHGILCTDGQRSTINLRYGLHSKKFAYDEIDSNWP